MENKKKKKGNILLFYLIAFGWSWLFWVPLILVENGISLPQGIINFLNSPYNPAAWGPLISALFVTYLYQRGPGLRSLIRRGVDFRFGFIWYIAAIFLFPAILGFAYFAAMLSGESMPELVAFADPISIPISFVFLFFTGGPLQEEFGWRGYAQTRLQKRWNALLASIFVGFMWAAWHLPLTYIPRDEAYYNTPIWGIFVSLILVSIIITWIFNNTGGSILAAMLAHTSYNWGNYLFPTLFSETGALIYIILLIFIAALIVIVFGARRMVRGEELPTKMLSEE